MATSGSRGTSVVGTTGSTWTNANAATLNDGAVGSNPGTLATWVNATKSASGTVTLGGYSFAPGSTSGLSVSACTGSFRHLESSTSLVATVTCQLQDSSGNSIGTAQTVTETTVATSAALTFTAPTATQVVNGLRTLTTLTHSGSSASSATFSLDYIDVTVTYTMSQTGAVTGHGVLSATALSSKFVLTGAATGHGVLSATAVAKKFVLTATAHGAGAASAAYTAPASTLVDNFATQDTTKWTGWDGTTAVASSQLQVTPAISGGVTTLSSAQTYNLTSSSASVCLTSFPSAWVGAASPLGSYLVLDMISTTGSNNYFTIGVYTDSSPTFATPVLLCSYVINNVQTILANPAYDYDAMKFVRIRHSAGTIFWDYSGDGSNWTNAISNAKPAGITITKMNALLQTANGSSVTGTGYYTNFNYFPNEALCVRDNFASQNTTLWGWGGGASVSGNQLVLACNASATGTIWSGSPFFFYQNQIQWQMAQVAATNDATAQTGMYLLSRYGPTTPNDSLLDMHVINGLLKIDSYDNAGTLTNVLSIAYNSSTMPYQRIRLDDTQTNYMFFDTAAAANGPWTNRWNGLPPVGFNAATAFLQFFTTCTTGSPAPSTAKFANVNINSTAVSTLQDFFASKDTTKFDYFPNAAVASQRLQLTATTSYDGAIYTRDVFDFVGSTVQAQLVQVAGTNLTNCDNYLIVGNSAAINDYVQLGVTNNLLQAQYIGADPVTASTRTIASTTYNSVQHRWLRIRHDGGSPATIYFEASPDTNTWTQITSIAETALAQYITSGRTGLASPNTGLYNVAYAGIYTGLQSVGSPNQVAIWDNFNVTVYPGLTTGQGVLSATATQASHSATGAATGHGVLSQTNFAKIASTGAATGHGVLSQTNFAKIATTAAATGHGVLSQTNFAKIPIAVPLAGHGVLSQTNFAKIPIAVPLAGHGVLSQTNFAKIPIAVPLAGHGVLSQTNFAKIATTAAATGHGVLSATATAKFSVTAALAGQGALSATATAKFAAPATLTGHGVLSATAPANGYPAAFIGHGVLSQTNFAKIAVAVPLTGHGVLLASDPASGGAGAFTGHGVLSQTNFAKFSAPATLTGHGVLSATTTPKIASAAVLTGHGVLSATAPANGYPATFTGHGVLSATATAKFSAPATFTGHGVLSATAPANGYPATFTGHGVLSATTPANGYPAAFTGHGVLSQTNFAKIPAAATLTGQGVLSATAPANGYPAAFTGHGVLSATAFAKIAATGAATGHGVLSQTNFAKIAVAVALAGHGVLSATTVVEGGTGAFTGTGVLSADAEAASSSVHPHIAGHGVLSATAPANGYPGTFTGHGVLSAAAFAKFSSPAALTGHGVLSATAPANGYPATFTGHGVLSASATAKFAAPSTLAGHGVLSATAPANGGAGAFTGHGVLSATATAKFARTAALTGHGALSATAVVNGGTGAFTGNGVLSASATPKFSDTATLTGHGALSATAFPKFSETATLTGNGTLFADAEPNGERAVRCTGDGALTATAHATKFTLTANPTGHGALTPTPAGANGGASTAGAGALTAGAFAKFSDTAALTGHGVLATTPAGAFGGASPHGHGALTQTNHPVIPAAGVLTGHGELSAAAHIKNDESGDATGHGALTATAVATEFTVTAHLSGVGTLTATIEVAVNAHPTGHGVLTVTARAKMSVTVALIGGGTLQAVAVAQYTVAPHLTGHGALSGRAQPVAAPHPTGHGVLTATALATLFSLPANPAGRGVLTNIVAITGGNRLTFFTVTGRFIAASEPNRAGNLNTPRLQAINALITFTPRVPTGIPLLVSNFVISEYTDAHQTITLLGGPTGGTFTLSFRGATTTAIAWNATPSQVQTALEALTTIGSGNVTVGPSVFAQGYDIQFTGARGGQALPPIAGHPEHLTNTFGAGFCEITTTVDAPGTGFLTADTAISLAPLRARIYNGILSTIDIGDTPGFQLPANTAALNVGGDLVYEVSFDAVTFNGADQVLAPFAFTAPAAATPVDITGEVMRHGFAATVNYADRAPVTQNMRQLMWNRRYTPAPAKPVRKTPSGRRGGRR